jgi:hypothetical protein
MKPLSTATGKVMTPKPDPPEVTISPDPSLSLESPETG